MRLFCIKKIGFQSEPKQRASFLSRARKLISFSPLSSLLLYSPFLLWYILIFPTSLQLSVNTKGSMYVILFFYAKFLNGKNITKGKSRSYGSRAILMAGPAQQQKFMQKSCAVFCLGWKVYKREGWGRDPMQIILLPFDLMMMTEINSHAWMLCIVVDVYLEKYLKPTHKNVKYLMKALFNLQ